jgi:hypothetical protein
MFSSGSRIEDSALRQSLIRIDPKQAAGCGSDRGKWLTSLPSHELHRVQAHARFCESKGPPCFRLTIWST